MNKIKVYIASPYTIGDQALNVRAQMDCFDQLCKYGLTPFSPLWSHFQHMIHPLSYDEWLAWDFVWLESCDCVLRLDGESKGADMEIEHAKLHNIPVFFGLWALLNHYKLV